MHVDEVATSTFSVTSTTSCSSQLMHLQLHHEPPTVSLTLSPRTSRSCGLGSDDGDDLDVIAPPGLVAKGFEPDSSARGGGEGLSDDAGTLVPGHTPWLPLKADLMDVRRSVLSTISCRNTRTELWISPKFLTPQQLPAQSCPRYKPVPGSVAGGEWSPPAEVALVIRISM
jgi:hypothetical protein